MKCTNANKYTTFAHGKKNLKLESSELIFRANSGEHYVWHNQSEWETGI